MKKKEEIKFFDIHSHLHSEFFKGNLEEVLSEMREKKVWTISIGVSEDDSVKAVELANQNENVFATIGVHPVDEKNSDFNEENFKKILDENKEKIVGIGECGLDYFWPKKDLESGKISGADFSAEKERQKILFEKQINFAEKNNLPLMLHIRSWKNGDAHEDALEILENKEKEFGKKIRANFHFYTEAPEMTKRIIGRGYFISTPGVITFADLDETVKNIPLNKIMSETDSPFAAPKPFRGKTNTPVFVEEVVRKISEIKNEDFEKIRLTTIENALNFWKI